LHPDPTSTAPDADVNRLLWALWAWVHLGGIGARTTRGFGALASIEVNGLSPEWKQRFTPPASNQANAWIRQLWQQDPISKTAPYSPLEWAHLGRAQIFVGEAVPVRKRQEQERVTHESMAHVALLRALREFRQGVPWGRAASNRGKPAGESHWPEPHMLRVHAEGSEQAIHWAHPPPPHLRDLVSRTKTSNEWIPPRAAFGLPIVMGFMDDSSLPGKDSDADATIELDKKGGRWRSPLRLRPIMCSDGQHFPMALLFPARPWTATGQSITVNKAPIYLIPEMTQPSVGGPIESEGWMRGAKGDAARAFFDWLPGQLQRQSDERDRSFRRRR
jgi:CRISPR-associated protein Cmr1